MLIRYRLNESLVDFICASTLQQRNLARTSIGFLLGADQALAAGDPKVAVQMFRWKNTLNAQDADHALPQELFLALATGTPPNGFRKESLSYAAEGLAKALAAFRIEGALEPELKIAEFDLDRFFITGSRIIQKLQSADQLISIAIRESRAPAWFGMQLPGMVGRRTQKQNGKFTAKDLKEVLMTLKRTESWVVPTKQTKRSDVLAKGVYLAEENSFVLVSLDSPGASRYARLNAEGSIVEESNVTRSEIPNLFPSLARRKIID
jgi:hypothetical protein